MVIPSKMSLVFDPIFWFSVLFSHRPDKNKYRDMRWYRYSQKSSSVISQMSILDLDFPTQNLFLALFPDFFVFPIKCGPVKFLKYKTRTTLSISSSDLPFLDKDFWKSTNMTFLVSVQLLLSLALISFLSNLQAKIPSNYITQSIYSEILILRNNRICNYP